MVLPLLTSYCGMSLGLVDNSRKNITAPGELDECLRGTAVVMRHVSFGEAIRLDLVEREPVTLMWHQCVPVATRTSAPTSGRCTRRRSSGDRDPRSSRAGSCSPATPPPTQDPPQDGDEGEEEHRLAYVVAGPVGNTVLGEHHRARVL